MFRSPRTGRIPSTCASFSSGPARRKCIRREWCGCPRFSGGRRSGNNRREEKRRQVSTLDKTLQFSAVSSEEKRRQVSTLDKTLQFSAVSSFYQLSRPDVFPFPLPESS